MSEDHGTLSGRMTKDRFGASMPVDAPYYQSPPFYYRDARSMTISFETDGEAAAELLPEGLTLPTPARAVLTFVHYPRSTFGPYNETILSIRCEWEGEAQGYIAHIAVDTVPPMVGGREIWGYPKKLAHIEIAQEQELVRATLERPEGVRLVTATMRPERPQPIVDQGGGGGSLSLRVIPSPEPEMPPSIAELVQVRSTDRQTHELWSGPATLSFDACSDLDPWHRLPVRKLLGGVFSVADFTLPHGRVIKSY